MLDTEGKVLKNSLRKRLAVEIVAAVDLSPRKTAFRTGHLTTDVIQEIVKTMRKQEEDNH